MSADVSAAVSALHDLVLGAVPADTEVFDGPADDRAYAARAVTVAAAFEDDQNAVTVERTFSGARPVCRETMEVACSVYAGSGDAGDDAADLLRASAGAIALRHRRGPAGRPDPGRRRGERSAISRADWLQGVDDARAPASSSASSSPS
jgi:hypothetical protein